MQWQKKLFVCRFRPCASVMLALRKKVKAESNLKFSISVLHFSPPGELFKRDQLNVRPCASVLPAQDAQFQHSVLVHKKIRITISWKGKELSEMCGGKINYFYAVSGFQIFFRKIILKCLKIFFGSTAPRGSMPFQVFKKNLEKSLKKTFFLNIFWIRCASRVH